MEETEIDALLDEGMTKYLITSFQEQHNEGYNVMNPVADTYGIYTTGAMPIQVAMDGFLYMTQDQDYRLDFITYYLSLLRGSFLRREKLTAVFMLKDTMMRLRIQDMNITHTSKIQDFAQMSIAGIGFSYQVYTGSFG